MGEAEIMVGDRFRTKRGKRLEDVVGVTQDAVLWVRARTGLEGRTQRAGYLRSRLLVARAGKHIQESLDRVKDAAQKHGALSAAEGYAAAIGVELTPAERAQLRKAVK